MPRPGFADPHEKRLDPHGVISAMRAIADQEIQFGTSVPVEGLDGLVFPNQVSEDGFA
jgi:hypothetical protein